MRTLYNTVVDLISLTQELSPTHPALLSVQKGKNDNLRTLHDTVYSNQIRSVNRTRTYNMNGRKRLKRVKKCVTIACRQYCNAK